MDVRAANLGAQWQSTQQVVATAEDAVEEIEKHVKALNEVGGLSNFNKAYKRYRHRCIATAMPAVPYSAHLHAFKLKIIKLVSKNVAVGADKFAGLSSVEVVFPGRKERLDDAPVIRGAGTLFGWSRRDATP